MTIGTRVDSTNGPVSTNNAQGFSVSRDSGNAGFGPFKVDSVNALTTSTTLGVDAAGVNTVSGSAALTQSMPLASDCPGATFVFRSLSAHAHVFTGSQETAGTKVFSVMSGTANGTGASGSRLTFGTTVGTSVMMISDGKSFLVLGASGSVTPAGT